MNLKFVACIAIAAILSGCGMIGGSDEAAAPAAPTMATAPAASGGGGSGQIRITENDITDRPYRVLGDISVSVPRAAVVDNFVQGKVVDALIAKAQTIHADAVILVHYSDSAFNFGTFKLGNMEGTGRAVVFLSSSAAAAPMTGGAAQAAGAQPAQMAMPMGRQLPTQADMKSTLQSYIAALNAGNAAAVVALYADDATIEDPLGTPPKRGKNEIAAAIRAAVSLGMKYELDTPIRGSDVNSAAMAIKTRVGQTSINAILVFTFNPDGRIASMKAYFGSDNRSR